MSFDTAILKDKIEGIKTAFENGQFSDALVAAMNTGNGLLQQRVFTQNVDVEGNSFGKYIGKKSKTKLIRSANRTEDKRNKAIAGQELTPYQKKRARAGRQTAKKDLELYGGLRRSIEVVVENETAVVLDFNNPNAAIIAHGQEQQIGRIRGSGTIKIFRLSPSEKEQVNEQGLMLINQILKPK